MKIIPLIILCLLCRLVYGQIEYDNNLAERKIAVDLYPFNVIIGSIGGNCEYLLKQNRGLLLEGVYAFARNKQGFSCAAHYRYHYYKKEFHKGLASPFIGGFLGFEYGDEIYKIDGKNYDIETLYIRVGANWGRRWVIRNGFTITIRGGYGIPTLAKITWISPKPDKVKSAEIYKKLIDGLDLELSIGFTL